MKLRELSVQTVPKHKYQKSFNTTAWCIQEMYWYQLKDLKTKDVDKVVVILGENKPERKFGNVLSIYRSFDFDNYFELNDYDRKKTVLEVLHNELLAISNEQDIDKERLNRAFEHCIQNKLDNKWLLKNKHFKSPDKKFYGSIECHWEPDNFSVYGVILDNKKNELYRRLLLTREPFLGDFIYYCKCGWDGDTFFLQSKEKEKWTISSK